MNFEELENAWGQQVPPSSAFRAADLKHSIVLAKRRSRLLAYGVGALAFALISYPALSLANFLHLHPVWPVAFWLNVGLHMLLNAGLLVYVLRRIARHRALQRQRATTVHEFAQASLASLDAEVRDLRFTTGLLPILVGLALLSGYMNHVGTYGGKLFATQAAILAAITLPIAWAGWRDYRVNLQPDQVRLRSLLNDHD